MLPITHQLKAEFPEVEQHWYADNAAAAAEFAIICAMFEHLLKLGHGYGYHPESLKSIVVVARHSLEREKVYFAELGFNVQTGSRYLGGFVREDEDRDEWLESKIVTWVDIIKQLPTVAGPYPQSAYAGMQNYVQEEWTFVQRVVWDVGNKFGAIGEAMHRSFLPFLLKETLPDNDQLHRLAALPMKSTRLALTDVMMQTFKRVKLLIPTSSR
jgi:hypothetical protein